MRITCRIVTLAVVSVATVMAGCSTSNGWLSRGQDPAEPMLVCRLANYGAYQKDGYAHLQSIGVKHVFINVPAPDQVESVQKELAKYGLDVVVMRGNTDLAKDSCVDELAEQLVTCHKMNVHYMFLSAKRHDASKEVVFDRLRRAGDVARKNDVTIVLETHPELGTNGDVHVETMRAIDNPNVRVNFDTGNITYYNKGADAVAELKKVLPYLATVEIKDHNCQFETWNFPALGQGKVNIPGVLAVLKKHGYRGPVTIEIEGIKGQERSEAQIKQDIAESVSYLRSLEAFR